MHRRFQQAYTALREHGSVSYAKIATISGFCDLDLIVIKATSPDDVPLLERYVQELLKIFSLSPSSSRAFSHSFTRRFGKTRCWRVALKCLQLVHRLLRALPESNSFRSDLLWARSNGLLSLNPCNFHDTSSSPSTSHHLTLFIRSYAYLLDEALTCFSFDEINKISESEPLDSLSEKMKEVGRVLDLLPQLQSLIDRVMDCHPIGAAARSFLVRSAMKQIVRDSFVCYEAFRRDIVVLLDNLFQMQYRSSISTLRIYKKAASQAIQLAEFYESCKEMGLCGLYEYPFVDKIPHIHVRALESFLNDMWQLTEPSSSTSMTSSSSPASPPSNQTEDGSDRQLMRLEAVISTEWEKFEEDQAPLIQWEGNDGSWEELLEASACVPRSLVFGPTGYGYGYGYEYGYGYGYRFGQAEEKDENEMNGWKVQVYDRRIGSNPFNGSSYNCYGYNTPSYYSMAIYNHSSSWGL